jgi:uncharacterized UPF0146 family protein
MNKNSKKMTKSKWSKKSEKIFSDIKKYGPTINRKVYQRTLKKYIKLKKSKSESPAEIKKIKNKLKKMDKQKEWERRGYFTKHYTWAVPNKTAIQKIKKFAKGEKILEVGAGLGLWSSLLQESGADIIATDDFSWKKKNHDKRNFTKVEKLNVQNSLNKYNDADVLLLVWPPYDNPMANNALKKFKGNKLIYIGEGEGEATANDNFYDRLEKHWKQVDEYDIPGWVYTHDNMTFYERK